MQLFEYLIAKDVSQTAFAKKIGVSQPTLHRYLVGETSPSVITAIQIEKLTGKEVKVHDWAKLSDSISTVLIDG